MSTTIRVSEETKSKLVVLKRDDENWDHFLNRLARRERDVEELGGFADDSVVDHVDTKDWKLNESLLADIDATWRDEGYNSRSEFIRETLQDAVRHPELTRESWKEIAAVEHARLTGDSETFSRDEILGTDE